MSIQKICASNGCIISLADLPPEIIKTISDRLSWKDLNMFASSSSHLRDVLFSQMKMRSNIYYLNAQKTMKTLNHKILIDTDFIVFRGKCFKRVVRFISEPWWHTLVGEEEVRFNSSNLLYELVGEEKYREPRVLKVGDATVISINGVRKIGEWVYGNAQNGSALIYEDHKTRKFWSHSHLERYYY